MTKFANAQSAAAAWWINFLKTNGIVDFVSVSEYSGRMRLRQRIADALVSTDGDGKVRLAYMPANGLTFILDAALRRPRLNRKPTCVFMELAEDYVHVTVDDQEFLLWRKYPQSVIFGHHHRRPLRPAHLPRTWPMPTFGAAELLRDGTVAIRSYDVLSPDEQHTRYCQADGCRCDSTPSSAGIVPPWNRYMLSRTPDDDNSSNWHAL